MIRALAVIASLAVAGCAAPAPPLAPLTMYGPELRIETWTPVVVERGHLHADLTDYPCPMTDLLQFAGALKPITESRAPGAADKFDLALGGMMDQMCSRQHGPAYGGPEHLVLALFRRGGTPEKPQEAIILDFPRLKAGESERRFQAGSFAAAWERPPKNVLAKLERGWVNVRRSGAADDARAARYDFEIFLVLAPTDGSGTPTQVVARVEGASRSQ
jgi:hypothetical protein